MKCPHCNGTGEAWFAVDIMDGCPCPNCDDGEIEDEDDWYELWIMERKAELEW